MAISENNKVLWSDIESLFTNLNTARKKFSMSTVTVPSNQNTTAKAETVNDLKDLIEAMSSSPYIGSAASTGVVDLTAGQLIEPEPLNILSNKITEIQNICAFNSSFFTSFNSSFNSSFFASFNSSFNSSNFASFNSSFNASHNNFGFTFNSSFNSSTCGFFCGGFSYTTSTGGFGCFCDFFE